MAETQTDLVTKVSLAETTPKQFVLECAEAVHIIRIRGMADGSPEDLAAENEGYAIAAETVERSWDAADRATREAVVTIAYGALCKAALRRNLGVEFIINGTEIALPPIALIADQIRDDMSGGLIRVVTR